VAIIKSPNEQYTGVSAGVSFVNGVGECNEPERLKWFERSGYIVEEVYVPDPGAGAPSTPPASADSPELGKTNTDIPEKPIKPAKAEK
jgi:hypothetical protein